MKRLYLAPLVMVGALTVGTLNAGWPVIDIAAIAKLLEQIDKMKEQIKVMEQQRDTMFDTYDQIRWSARFLTSKWRWKAAFRSWMYPSYTNDSGKTLPWLKASKNSADAIAGIAAVVGRLPDIVDKNGHWGSPEIEEIKRKHHALMEIMDGTHINTLALIGDVRSVQQDRSQAIAELEAQALSDDPDENTEAALLNKNLAASMVAVRQQQDIMKLATATADMELQRNLRERNSIADAARRDRAFRVGHRDTSAQIFGGTSAVLQSYRGF